MTFVNSYRGLDREFGGCLAGSLTLILRLAVKPTMQAISFSLWHIGIRTRLAPPSRHIDAMDV
jgi:hypothetical protein